MVLSRRWYWNFALFVCWYGHFLKTAYLSFFLSMFARFFLSFLLTYFFSFFLHSSPQSHRVCCSLFVVWAIIQNAGLSSDRHWSKEMRNDLHSLAPLHFHLPYYYQTRARPSLHVHTRAHVHAHTLPALSQMISEVSSAKRHPNL